MAAYISFGVEASSLLSASVMAAPCALALSKLMYPETEESKTTHKHIKNAKTKYDNYYYYYARLILLNSHVPKELKATLWMPLLKVL